MTTRTKPYIRVKNIAAYLNGIRDKENNHAIIYPSGQYFYLVNGNEVPGNEFESNNPIPVLQENRNDKGMRLDSRSNWID